MGEVTVHHADSREVLKGLADASIDSVVCDPPYALVSIGKRFGKPGAAPAKGDVYARASAGFMGQAWDTGETAFAVEFWAEVFRVLKPGGYVVAFSGTRTYHRLACAIEDAGFELRDMIAYLYGSGFPKSHSVIKAILPKVQSRYGDESKCRCVDSGDGRAAGDNVGRSSGEDVRLQRAPIDAAQKCSGYSELSVHPGAEADGLRELQPVDPEKASRPSEIAPPVLLSDVRGCRAEEARRGNASLWAGVEESTGGDTQAGQGLPELREDAGAERLGPACASPEAIPVRRNEPAEQLGRPVRRLPSHDRGDNGAGSVVDPDRREPRRVIPDDQCGWPSAVAHVCSWCGLPDAEWLRSLEPLGSALKPALEPIVLARKPLVGTVAANVLHHGTGALNIDGCRIGTGGGCKSSEPYTGGEALNAFGKGLNDQRSPQVEGLGRWPANVVHDGSDEVVEAFPDAPGQQRAVTGAERSHRTLNAYGDFGATRDGFEPRGDSGSAARFFYTAKADKLDRLGSKHPTVKPIDLMQWLCRLVTPPGGTVLDPFAGSGTTGVAAYLEGFDAVLIEREAPYLEDIHRRIAWVKGEGKLTAQEISRRKPTDNTGQNSIFGDAA